MYNLKFLLRVLVPGLLVSITLFATGCASSKKAEERPLSDLQNIIPEIGYRPSATYGDVAIDDNKHVDQWLKYFTGRGRKYMQTYLERSARYIPMMKATFRERGMPDELAYIAMIESGFSPTAFSHASAVGYWQFIRDTGKRYNLRIDQFVDERRDPILSTQAAANYLDALFSLFGDWHLSMAAYNAGERRIQRAVMKYRTRNFWELSKNRRALASETDNYIPKYIAAVKIAKNPAMYGFINIDFQDTFAFDSVIIDKPVSLDLIAKELKIDFTELKRMNPRYKSDYVPVYSDRINAVRVPVGMKDLAVASMSKFYSEAPRIYVAEFDYYKVRRGDTLSHIAKRHRTTISRLRDLNDLSRRSLLRIGQRIKVPDQNGFSRSSSTSKSTAVSSGASSAVSMESSDELQKKSLAKIMMKRQIAAIKQKAKTQNQTSKMSQNHQKISKNSYPKTPSKSLTLETANRKVHVVRRGENLSVIAKKYRTSVALIARENSLTNRAKIFVGRELIIPN
jgi:membrane-bound lytic murein transglycosylase D